MVCMEAGRMGGFGSQDGCCDLSMISKKDFLFLLRITFVARKLEEGVFPNNCAFIDLYVLFLYKSGEKYF